MADFLIGHLIVFWGAAMFFNMKSVQTKQRMGSRLKIRNMPWDQRAKNYLASVDAAYLLRLSCCIVYLLSTAFRQNLNRIYCRDTYISQQV